jgi:hypothetical protein
MEAIEIELVLDGYILMIYKLVVMLNIREVLQMILFHVWLLVSDQNYPSLSTINNILV